MNNRFDQRSLYILLACVAGFYLVLATGLFLAAPSIKSATVAVSSAGTIVGLFLGVMIIGYILGSLPFGLWVGMAFAGKDIRQVGSGKTGMTNVMRAAGRKAGALALLLDVFKSALAVLIAALIFNSAGARAIHADSWREAAMVAAAFAAIAGHNWSVFLSFKGGRGVATFVGGLLVMYWQAALIGGLLTLIIGFRTRYMSMGSIIGAVTAFIILMAFSILKISFLGPYPAFVYVLYTMVGAIFIYVIHRDNISRLYNGTERKIGEKTKSSGPNPS